MNPFFVEGNASWFHMQTLPNVKFVCGFCNTSVSSIKGYKLGLHGDGSGQQSGASYICPNCGGPSFFSPKGTRYPMPSLGNSVLHVPNDLNNLYEEARRSSGQNCFTGSVLLCRKMLMNIAVTQGAPEGLKFTIKGARVDISGVIKGARVICFAVGRNQSPSPSFTLTNSQSKGPGSIFPA